MAGAIPTATDCCLPCNDCPEDTNVPGSPGAAATAVIEPPGVNCANGGIKVTDGEGNVSYVCNGDPGTDAGITVEAEAPGLNCAAGGIKVTDSDLNVSYVCNGVDAAGTNGDDGINAFTVTTANFTQPAEGATVVVEVANSTWIASGQHLYVTGGGDYEVTAIPDGTHVTLRNLENTASALYPGNAAPAAVIGSGAAVSPGGIQGPIGATGAAATIANYFKVNKNAVDQAHADLGVGIQVTFAATEFDPSAVFNLATDTWTCPATGIYRFNLQLAYEESTYGVIDAFFGPSLYKNGGPGVGTQVALSHAFWPGTGSGGVPSPPTPAGGAAAGLIDTMLSLTVGDTIQVWSKANLGDNVADILGATSDTWFEGWRVA